MTRTKQSEIQRQAIKKAGGVVEYVCERVKQGKADVDVDAGWMNDYVTEACDRISDTDIEVNDMPCSYKHFMGLRYDDDDNLLKRLQKECSTDSQRKRKYTQMLEGDEALELIQQCLEAHKDKILKTLATKMRDTLVEYVKEQEVEDEEEEDEEEEDEDEDEEEEDEE